MIRGVRQLPTMHVSRVPWDDGRWAGKICANPRSTSCLILPRCPIQSLVEQPPEVLEFAQLDQSTETSI